MKHVILGLTLMCALMSFSSAANAKAFYYEFSEGQPVKNGIVYYEKDEKLMKLYGHQEGISGFHDYLFEVDDNNRLIVTDITKNLVIQFGAIDINNCPTVENYYGESVSLCRVSFGEGNEIDVSSRRFFDGWTDANGAPSVPYLSQDFNFTLIWSGKKVSVSGCMDHFLSCRL